MVGVCTTATDGLSQTNGKMGIIMDNMNASPRLIQVKSLFSLIRKLFYLILANNEKILFV